MIRRLWIGICLNLISLPPSFALECSIPSSWEKLRPIILSRVNQQNAKMKLKSEVAEGFCHFLKHMEAPTPKLAHLKTILPKTTLELLMSVYARGVKMDEAEKMAQYLNDMINAFQFKKPSVFDENTSHIIGRNWHEIDYSGEGMTWQKQKALYSPYNISNFKSLDNLKRFFPVESELPYFKKAYLPKNPDIFRNKNKPFINGKILEQIDE